MVAESGHTRDDGSGYFGKSRLFTSRSLLITLIGALAGGFIFGLMGYFAENGIISLPRLEPLFAAPYFTVTIFMAIFGAGLGAVIGSLATAEHIHREDGGMDEKEQNANKWISWVIAVLVVSVILSATGYIWILSAAYGSGADQDTRIGYTLKNVQRVPGDTSSQVGAYMTGMFPNQVLEIPGDPLAAAVMAPVASAGNQTLVYGGAETGPVDMMPSLRNPCRFWVTAPLLCLFRQTNLPMPCLQHMQLLISGYLWSRSKTIPYLPVLRQ